MTLFTSGSLPFLQALLGRLRTHGVRGGYMRTRTSAFDLHLSHRDSLALYHVMYDTTRVASCFLPRKREKLEKAIQALRLQVRS